ncbi:MAG TPA: hypothetical protein VIM41_10480 [Gammaproteobacteria bacterium]
MNMAARDGDQGAVHFLASNELASNEQARLASNEQTRDQRRNAGAGNAFSDLLLVMNSPKSAQTDAEK